MSGARGAVVIGLAGGIGSGKSAVGLILEELGFVVIDSDEESKAALGRDDVKASIRSWWGDGVFGDDGEIDRARVASIVFGDDAERRRLEALIHPIVKKRRGEVIAAAGDRVGAVIDAPLLFEAGLDSECDAIVFVDAPRDARVERVRARGWDEAELDRREAAQIPIDEKRLRSSDIVQNTGDLAALRVQVVGAVARILRRLGVDPGRGSGGVSGAKRGG